MIVTVTPSPAIDVTYRVGEFDRGAVNRVSQVIEQPGGKGVNVARVLHQLDVGVVAMGLSGGPGGTALTTALEEAGVATDFVDALPDVRRTVVVHESDGTTTSLWEPGRRPDDPVGAADELVSAVGRHLDAARAVVVSGSLPDGLPADVPARIAAAAAAADVPSLLDVQGSALATAARTGGAVLTPNSTEVAALTGGGPPGSALELIRAVSPHVRPVGAAPAVVVTLGADGIVAVLPDGALLARPPEVVTGNPTGAGDALAAALARWLADAGRFDRMDWPRALADAVALSAAAVARPVAGEIDRAAYDSWRSDVTVEVL